MKWNDSVKVLFALILTFFLILKCVLDGESTTFRQYEAAFLSYPWMLTATIIVWCSAFFFLRFKLPDLLLVGFLFFVLFICFIGRSQPSLEMIDLITSVTVGKGIGFLLQGRSKDKKIELLLIGLVIFMGFSALRPIDLPVNSRHGFRWMGYWNNPNIYGMLMAVGLVLPIGLLADEQLKMADSVKKQEEQRRKVKFFGEWKKLTLSVAVGLTGA